MLAFSRKKSERFHVKPCSQLRERLESAGIDPRLFDVEVMVVEIRGDNVRLGVTANTALSIQREDVKKKPAA